MTPFSFAPTNKGFTLVELAIALMIIGLLIGGVLKGIELVDNARVTQVLRDRKDFETATLAFQSIYGAKPGDLQNPSVRLPNCSTAPCSQTGNLNNRIGNTLTTTTSAIPTGATTENRTYWLHLAVAGLIKNIQTTYTGTPNTFGMDFPASPFTATGYEIMHYRNVDSHWVMPMDHYLVLTRGPGAAQFVNGSLETLIVKQIDDKADDGSPVRGDIVTVSSCGNSYVSGTYNMNTTAKCSPAMRMAF